MAEGWEKLYRKITETWLWDDKPFARGQAFTDLMLMVNHTENKVFFDGEVFTVKRGQRITSLRQLGERWGWSRTKVVKFLETLKKEGRVEYISDKKKTLITIVNSDLYDNEEATEMTLKSHRNDSEVTLKDTNKNEKNDNNEKNEKEISSSSNNVKSENDNLIYYFNENICELKKITKGKFEKFIESKSREFVTALIDYQTEIGTKSYAGFAEAIEKFKDLETVEELNAVIEQFRNSKKQKTEFVSKKKNNDVGKFNSQVSGFRQKNYDYDALQRELLGWTDEEIEIKKEDE